MYDISHLGNHRLNHHVHACAERLPGAARTRGKWLVHTHPNHRVRGSLNRRAVSKPCGRSRNQCHQPSHTVDAGQPDSCSHTDAGVDANIAAYAGVCRRTKIHLCNTC